MSVEPRFPVDTTLCRDDATGNTRQQGPNGESACGSWQVDVLFGRVHTKAG
jgi:hypothetical protein